MPQTVATDFQLLFDKYVVRQQGLFTTQQAYDAGYSRQSQSYHVLTGNWERHGRGIFRLKHYPCPDDLDMLVAYLWATNRSGQAQAVISHDSALHHYDLSTSWPSGVHLTVPKGFRRESVCVFKTKLHYADKLPSDTQYYRFMKMTTPLRTIVDLLVAGDLENKHLHEAILNGLRKGLISYWVLLEAQLSDREEELLFDLLASVNYQKLDELRQSR